MIFVTVGTWRFDQLIEVVDQAVSEGRIARPVVAQIANGLYLPRHCKYFRSAPSLAPYYEQADLVVAHGGTGTTLEVLERRQRLISVANPAVQDNHQDEFLVALEREGYVAYCRDLVNLPELIEQSFGTGAQRVMNGSLWTGVSKAVDALPAPCGKRRHLLERWCRRWLGCPQTAEGVVEVQCNARAAAPPMNMNGGSKAGCAGQLAGPQEGGVIEIEGHSDAD